MIFIIILVIPNAFARNVPSRSDKFFFVNARTAGSMKSFNVLADILLIPDDNELQQKITNIQNLD